MFTVMVKSTLNLLCGTPRHRKEDRLSSDRCKALARTGSHSVLTLEGVAQGGRAAGWLKVSGASPAAPPTHFCHIGAAHMHANSRICEAGRCARRHQQRHGFHCALKRAAFLFACKHMGLLEAMRPIWAMWFYDESSEYHELNENSHQKYVHVVK